MTELTNVLLVVLGVMFMIGAFVAQGIRGAFSRSGLSAPISKAGRVILFLIGISCLLAGIGVIAK